jgi:hypothetical protein
MIEKETSKQIFKKAKQKKVVRLALVNCMTTSVNRPTTIFIDRHFRIFFFSFSFTIANATFYYDSWTVLATMRPKTTIFTCHIICQHLPNRFDLHWMTQITSDFKPCDYSQQSNARHYWNEKKQNNKIHDVLLQCWRFDCDFLVEVLFKNFSFLCLLLIVGVNGDSNEQDHEEKLKLLFLYKSEVWQDAVNCEPYSILV